MADLSSGVNTFSYSGSAVEYDIPTSGTITVELWGAAGGGAYSSNFAGHGGGGALVQFEMNVTAGDVLKIEVGQGGRKAPNAPGNGGLGGWPDGGSGGAYAPLAPVYGCPGGGGSTRVYINNTLVAVAGAGGGGIYSPSNNGQSGGHGGATTGGIDDRNYVVAATQSQGGYPVVFGTYGVTPTNIRGGFLSGGNGWRDGSGDAQADNNTTPTEWTGAGGGGGYYGGSGGAAGERQFPAAGGGTSYANGSLVSSSTLTSAFWFTPPNTANRPSGVAEGGLTANGTQTDGGNGYVWLEYEPSGQIGDAFGDLATATLTAPAAAGEGGFNASFDIGTVVMSAPTGVGEGPTHIIALLGPIEVAITTVDGEASVQAGGIGNIGTVSITSVIDADAESQVYADGLIGTVEVQCNIVAGPVSEANITVDLLFELDPPESYWTDEGDSATGAAEVPGEEQPDLAIGTISVGDVQGYYYSEDQEVDIEEIGTVTMVPAEGYAAQAVASPDLPGPVVATSLLDATATGAVSVSGPISIITEGGGGVLFFAPEAVPSTPDMEAPGDFGAHVTVEPILGVGLQGDDIVLAIGQAIPAVTSEWTNTDSYQGTGQALAIPLLNGNSDDPTERYISRAVVGAILGTAAGGSNKEVFFDLTVTFGTPQGLTQQGQNILAPIGTVYVRRALGGAGDEPNIEGDALTEPLSPVIVTAPIMDYNVEGNASGELGVVYVLPPPVEANVGQDFPLDIPGPIILTPPEGAGWEVDPSSTGNGDLTALVTISAPEGAVVVLVAAVMPPAVRILPIQTVFHVVPLAGTAVFIPVITGDAILRRVENGVAVVEDRIEATVVVRG